MTGKARSAWWQGEITFVVATVLFLLCGVSVANATTVNSRGSEGVATVRPEFVSFGIDASQLFELNSGQPFDFNRPALKNLASPLAPAFIRYSGTKIESTFYDDTNTLPWNGAPSAYKAPGDARGFVLSRDEWVAALDFADQAGLSVIASTSNGPGPRNMDGTWNPDNARSLFERAVAEGHPPAAVMLGNEPNITYYGSGIPSTYAAADYARDVNDFLALKSELVPGSTFVGPGPFLSTGSERPLNGGNLGPDIADIMTATGSRYDVVSYHQYPAFGDSAKCAGLTPRLPEDTLSDEFLDTPNGAFEYMKGLRDLHSPGKPIWIDESGNTACGGVEGFSDKFISTFYYLNSLGYLAKNGVEVVTRWTLSGPQPYALIDDETLKPRADYWAALLWRKLMGQRVLDPVVTSADPKLRVYSQCQPGVTGGVTTLLLNTSRTDSKTVNFSDDDGAAKQYVVTGALDGDEVNLNGTLLEAGPAGQVPAIEGVPVQGGQVAVPAASYAFVTVPAADAEACGGTHRIRTDLKTKLNAPKQSLRRILKTGRIKTVCHTNFAARCAVGAAIPAAQARRLGLTRRKTGKQAVIGSTATSSLRAGARTVILKIKGRKLRKLRRAPDRFRPRVIVNGVGSAPDFEDARAESRKLRLKR